tara:strand:- start:8822 stop:9286 length:465 start_codon:yes stop_codon:yes gene_type:complete
MARKTFVDLSDTLNAFRVKTNLISFNVGDLDSLAASLPDSDLVQAINHLNAKIDSSTGAIHGNDSDILDLQTFIGFNGGGGTSLLQQILNNDSDIAALQLADSDLSNLQAQITSNDSDIAAINNTGLIRTASLAILRSDGNVVKRIFGYTDSGV